MDQALTLRRMAAVSKQGIPTTKNKQTKVLSFTSGKGGVGKSHIVVNLACALQRRGSRVMVLDADLGLANIDILLGLTPHYNVQHLLTGQKGIEDVLVQGPAGMLILPAGSGIQELVHLSEDQRCKLFSQLDAIENRFDFLLIDTAAGISSDVTYFNITANDIIVIVTPEPTSITDAYALLKLQSTKYGAKNFKIIINMATDTIEGEEAFRRLNLATNRFLDVGLDYLGCIVYDTSFTQAVRYQKPLIELYPSSAAAQCFRHLAKRLTYIPDGLRTQNNVPGFWQQLLTSSDDQHAALRRQSAKAVL